MSTILYNQNILSGGDMSLTSVSSSPVQLSKTDGYSIYASWTGAPVGTIKLQVSNDNQNFLDLPSSPQAVNGAGNFMWNVGSVFYQYVQVVYTKTSGTGSLNVEITGKGSFRA